MKNSMSIPYKKEWMDAFMQHDNNDNANKSLKEGEIQTEIERLFEQDKEYTGKLHIENIHGWDVRYIGVFQINDLFNALFNKVVRISIIEEVK